MAIKTATITVAAKRTTPEAKSAAIMPAHKRKAIEANTDVSCRNSTSSERADTLGLTTFFMNMSDIFYLDEDRIMADPDGAARAFYEQAWRLGSNVSWKMCISEKAVDMVRFRLVKYMEVTDYELEDCLRWPISDTGPLSLRLIAEDLKKIYYDDRRRGSFYGLD